MGVTGGPHGRAAVKVRDVGLRMHRHPDTGRPGFEVIVGGGLGLAPIVVKIVREHLPLAELVPYLTAIMRVYNRHGRRDNKFKARIKILVHELTAPEFIRQVEEEYELIRHDGEAYALAEAEVARIAAYFAPPAYERLPERDPVHDQRVFENKAFAQWVRANTVRHKMPGYAIANISLKPIGGIPGDATSAQMRKVAELADDYSHGEIRVTHHQNLVLPDVRIRDLFAVWEGLVEAELATPNIGLVSDIIACPGMDYCSLATARSIPIAQAISTRFEQLDRQLEVGPLEIKISGCINACGHHHIGHIGILGVDKHGQELYQVTLGGSPDETAAIGTIIGPGFAGDRVVDAVETIVDTYVRGRDGEEPFLAYYRRVGQKPFKEALYGPAKS